MATDRSTLFARLEEFGIATTTVEHAPMFTVEQSGALRKNLPGAHTKNLFLTDRVGHLVLVVAKDDTRVDLKALAKRLEAGRLSFGKEAQLEAVLGVPPGSVTPLALINPSAAGIIVVVDKALMDFAGAPPRGCQRRTSSASSRLAAMSSSSSPWGEAACRLPAGCQTGRRGPSSRARSGPESLGAASTWR